MDGDVKLEPAEIIRRMSNKAAATTKAEAQAEMSEAQFTAVSDVCSACGVCRPHSCFSKNQIFKKLAGARRCVSCTAADPHGRIPMELAAQSAAAEQATKRLRAENARLQADAAAAAAHAEAAATKAEAQAAELAVQKVAAEQASEWLRAENARLQAELAAQAETAAVKAKAVAAELAAQEQATKRLRAENEQLRGDLAAHVPDTVDLTADGEGTPQPAAAAGGGGPPPLPPRGEIEAGVKRNAVTAELHQRLAAVKREKNEAVEEAEDQQETTKDTALMLDRWQVSL